MVIGEAPGATEDGVGLPFVGRSGKLLERLLEENGFDVDEVFITNAVSCRPPDNRTPSKAEIKACKKWLDYQIAMVKPKYVLLLGNTPLQSITGKAGISRARGRPIERDGIIYLPTFHPAYAIRDPKHEATLSLDIATFQTIVEHGSIPREDNLNLVIVDSDKKLRQFYAAVKKTLVFDIETTCLYPWQTHEIKKRKAGNVRTEKPAKVISIGFATADTQYTIPFHHPKSPWKDDPDKLEEIIAEIDRLVEERDVKFVAHNAKFDCLWMLVHFGVKWFERVIFDTMIAHYLLDENDRHGLKYLAQLYFGAPDWEIDKDEKQGDGDLDKHCLYLAHDVYYTRRLWRKLQRMLWKETDLWYVFDLILMPCVRLFTQIEADGVYIDISKFDDAEEYLRGELADAKQKLDKWAKINWGSTKQVCNLLYNELEIEVIERTKTGNPSASESALNQIDHPIIGDLKRYRGAKQQLSFFIDGWKPFLHRKAYKGEARYYLHPSFKLHGTVTGRPSCEHPNLQQVPRDARIRSLITAPEGYVLIDADLSQIELRIAAELANERAMLYAFTHGIDAHWLTCIKEIERSGGLEDIILDTARTWKQNKKIKYAEAIEILLEMGPDAAAEINKEWKEYRKKAKAINFGYLYGMWWKKFKMYARDNYGVEIDDKQAQASRVAFFDTYRDFPEWHARQRRYARRHGYIRTLSGRKRRLPQAQFASDTPERREAERQAINSPVQSFASDLNLMAALQLSREFPRRVLRIVGTVHDSILMIVREEHVEEVHRRILEVMRQPDLLDVLGIELGVPIDADASIGPWGAGEGIDKWLSKYRSRRLTPGAAARKRTMRST